MLQGWVQILLTLLIVILVTPILGKYIAQVFLEERPPFYWVFQPLDQLIYRGIGIAPEIEMTPRGYISTLLTSNLVMGIVVFLLLMIQGQLPFNPTQLYAPRWDTALHTTISFLTNTDQQHYTPEATFSYFSQVVPLGFLFFTSAGTGISVSIAFIRGLTGRSLGNFYSDLTRSITHILLPLSVVGAVVLMAAGVPETLAHPVIISTLENPSVQQSIAVGPVAHLEIIKQLGENGGGFFAANSAHPFENPNGLSNLIHTVAMLAIPAALIYTYGVFANNLKQAWLIYGMVFILYGGFIIVVALQEYQGNPLINHLLGSVQPNLEGKEVRFGWAQSALYSVTTTGTMTGAVNGMLDSFMPLSAAIFLANLFLQVIWGGQGTGTAYLFAYIILAVFVTGLMVGRTPEFLGRKIEQREVVLTSFLILLVHPIAILIPGAITLAFPEPLAGVSDPGFHGLTQVMYEYASAAANNGSGFAALGNTSLWWNITTMLSLLAGRYIPIVALILLAGSMAAKPVVPPTTGTLRTDTVLFTSITTGIVLIMGALTFFPVLALGAIAEHFQLMGGVA